MTSLSPLCRSSLIGTNLSFKAQGFRIHCTRNPERRLLKKKTIRHNKKSVTLRYPPPPAVTSPHPLHPYILYPAVLNLPFMNPFSCESLQEPETHCAYCVHSKMQPHSLHLTFYTLQFTPCTLHPTVYTLHFTPYVLHPALQTA